MITKIMFILLSIAILSIAQFSCGCLSNPSDGSLDTFNESPLYEITDTSFSYSNETLQVNHSWRYDNKNMELNSVYPKDLISYYESLSHDRTDLSGYMTTTYDKQMIGDLAQSMNNYGLKYNWTKEQKIMNVITFVNSVNRNPDNTDHYPAEILVYGSSGNKDSAILSTCIISEMGYDSILVEIGDHYEIGIKDENRQGQYIEYNNATYFLTEPENPYFIGYVLPQYRNKLSKIYSPDASEAVINLMDCSLTPTGSNKTHRFYEISEDIINCGPGSTNITLYLYALSGSDTVCKPDYLIEELPIKEGQHISATATLAIPNYCTVVPECAAWNSYSNCSQSFDPIEPENELTFIQQMSLIFNKIVFFFIN